MATTFPKIYKGAPEYHHSTGFWNSQIHPFHTWEIVDSGTEISSTSNALLGIGTLSLVFPRFWFLSAFVAVGGIASVAGSVNNSSLNLYQRSYTPSLLTVLLYIIAKFRV